MDLFITRRGSNGGLNFRVVGGTTKPGNPRDNTIWIESDVKITNWVFDKEPPENPTEGSVWIQLGGSDRRFNAINRNALYISVNNIRQYMGGSWQNTKARIYLDSEWLDVFDGYLFNNGIFSSVYEKSSYKSPSTCVVDFIDNIFTCATTAEKTSEVYAVFGPVNLSAYKKIITTGLYAKRNPEGYIRSVIYIATEPNLKISGSVASKVDSFAFKKVDTEFTTELDLTTLSDENRNREYYIYCGTNTNGAAWANKRTVTFYTVRVE